MQKWNQALANADVAEVIYLAMRYEPEHAAAIAKALHPQKPRWAGGAPSEEVARGLEGSLLDLGTHDVTGLIYGRNSYGDVLQDVTKRLGVEASEGSVVDLEEALLRGVFESLWERINDEERQELLLNMGINPDEGLDPGILAASSTVVTQLLLKQFGGFAVYKFATVAANAVARQVLGRGLSLAANAALTRLVGVALGPIGVGVSLGWLGYELLGPAYRKVVPAVIQVAATRRLLGGRTAIGVVGAGSAGKDACIATVFGLTGGGSSPMAGSTAICEMHSLPNDWPGGTTSSSEKYVVNFPGFFDRRAAVNQELESNLAICRGFIVVIDATSGVSAVDQEIVEQVKGIGREVLVAFNKIDLLRPADRQISFLEAQERLGLADGQLVQTAFDPDERLGEDKQGVSVVREWAASHMTVK
jgi:uncharacterized protein YaaW (UPF0174 family)/GTP-binding protein EngB required for normal cell division